MANAQELMNGQRVGSLTHGMGGDVVEYEAELAVAEMKARQTAMMEALIYNALRRPRDEDRAIALIQRACKRETFARMAIFSYPKGGKNIEGASIHLARELAKCYQNIRTGLQVLYDDGERIMIEGFAWDMENNVYNSLSDEFKLLIQRKVKDDRGRSTGETEWITPDEREKRELVFRRGSILVRNCILAIVPKDIIEDAMTDCRETLKIKPRDLGAMKKRLIKEFDELGVSTKMLQAWLAERRRTDTAKLSDLTAEDLTDLRGIANSLHDRHALIGDFFQTAPAPGMSQTEGDDGATIDPKKVSAGTRETSKPGDQGKDKKDDKKKESGSQEGTEPPAEQDPGGDGSTEEPEKKTKPDVADLHLITVLCKRISDKYGGVKKMTGDLKPLRDEITKLRAQARGETMTLATFEEAKKRLNAVLEEKKEPDVSDERAELVATLMEISNNDAAMADADIGKNVRKMLDDFDQLYYKNLAFPALKNAVLNLVALMDERGIGS